MDRVTPLSLVIAMTPWRTPEYPVGVTAAMEEVCRGMRPDRVHWPALLDRLMDDGLTEAEAAARLRHLSREAVQLRDMTRAVAAMCEGDGRGAGLVAAVIGDAEYAGRSLPVYVVPGYCHRRVRGPAWLTRWHVAGPCVVVGARTVQAMARRRV